MPVDDLMSMLRAHRVTAVADVRSQPHSRMNPQFNREALGTALARAAIKYVFLGKELGARASDPSLYNEGTVSYQRLGDSPLFQEGLRRVLEGAKIYRIALLCAEREPLACHRSILVARRLQAAGVSMAHIRSATDAEAHAQLETRLLKLAKLPEHDMFQTRDELVARAYLLQEKRIAYRSPENAWSNPGTEEPAGMHEK